MNYVRNVLRGVSRHKEHTLCGFIYMKIWAREKRIYGGTTAFDWDGIGCKGAPVDLSRVITMFCSDGGLLFMDSLLKLIGH